MKQTIAVFCGSKLGANEKENANLAYACGQRLAKSGFNVLTGGGPGMMEEVSRGAFEAGTNVVSVQLEVEGREQSKYANKIYRFKSIIPRQQKIISLADAYVVLPGGLGTWYETIEVLVKKYFGEIKSHIPLILVGRKVWGPVLSQVEILQKQGFMDESFHKKLTLVDTVEQAVTILKKYYKK